MRIKKFLLGVLKVFVYVIFIPYVILLAITYAPPFFRNEIYFPDPFRLEHLPNLVYITLAYFLFCILFFSIQRYYWRKWIVIAFLLLPALFFVIDYLYRWDWYKGLFFSMFYSVINATYYLLFGVFYIAFLLLERKTTLKAVFRGIIAISGQIFVVCGMVIFSFVYFYQKMGL